MIAMLMWTKNRGRVGDKPLCGEKHHFFSLSLAVHLPSVNRVKENSSVFHLSNSSDLINNSQGTLLYILMSRNDETTTTEEKHSPKTNAL